MKSKILSLLSSWLVRIFLGVLFVAVLAYYFFGTSETTTDYLLMGSVEQGDLTLSISESGQVSDEEEIELTPETSSKVTGVYVDEGDYVKKGQLLLALDASDASFDIEDAKINLAQAEQDLEELDEPADEIDIKKAENEVTKAENELSDLLDTYNNSVENKQKEIDDLEESKPDAYDSAYNEAISVFSTLPDVFVHLETLINGNDISREHSNLAYYVLMSHDQDLAEDLGEIETAYEDLEDIYDLALDSYENADRTDYESIEDLAQASYDTVEALSDLLKSLDLYLTLANESLGEDFEFHDTVLSDRDQVIDDANTINPLLNSIDDELSNITDIDDSIAEAQDDLVDLADSYEQDKASAELTLEEKQLELEDLQDSDSDELDYKSQELVVRQRKNDLAKAQESYQDYFLYASVAGYISAWDVDLGDSVSSSTVVGTLIDNHKQVVVSLNELDISDIELGQTATVTFDAIPDFEAEGVVVKKDISGTVNSGVVSYEVTLSIQSDDERILTGMSADVDIVLLSKPDVTLVSKLAVKEDPEGKYVQLVTNKDALGTEPFYALETVKTEKVYLEVGDEDDVNYEVLSGLEVGDPIVLSTITLSSDETDSGSFGLPSGDAGGGAEFSPPSGASTNIQGGPPSF